MVLGEYINFLCCSLQNSDDEVCNTIYVLITNDKYLCLQTIAFMRWVALIHPITNRALRGWILGWASGCQCHLCQIEGNLIFSRLHANNFKEIPILIFSTYAVSPNYCSNCGNMRCYSNCLIH